MHVKERACVCVREREKKRGRKRRRKRAGESEKEKKQERKVKKVEARDQRHGYGVGELSVLFSPCLSEDKNVFQTCLLIKTFGENESWSHTELLRSSLMDVANLSFHLTILHMKRLTSAVQCLNIFSSEYKFV